MPYSSKTKDLSEKFTINDLYPHNDSHLSLNDAVTPIQSGAFNALLTEFSHDVYRLQNSDELPVFLHELSENFQQEEDKQYYHGQNQSNQLHQAKSPQFDTALHNWLMLLNHVYTVLLPELYVFFHDDTCTSIQRKKVHKSIEDILKNAKSWLLQTHKYTRLSPLEKQIYHQNSSINRLIDDYIIGNGLNADIACKILPLAQLSTINGFLYLNHLDKTIHLLTHRDWLIKFLLQDSSDVLIQLNDMMQERHEAFSIADANVLMQQPSLLRDENDHPLIQHIQQSKQIQHNKTTTQPSSQLVEKNNRDTSTSELDNSKPLGKVKSFFKSMFKKDTNLVNDNHSKSRSDHADNPASSQPQKADKNQTHLIEQKVLLPINLQKHAFYLAQILSSESLTTLQRLISALNESHSYLDYLEEHHPYLATSVHELIKDLTINTVLRLDQMAKNFIKDGVFTDKVKALFEQNHAANIQALMTHNLQELDALNASILEKQMAGFATVGSKEEVKFRDTMMELKILLKWFVAQAPEDSVLSTVSSYEVILNKLENSTLKQMNEVYYQHDTSQEQRRSLQLQLDELLAHFQSQSPKSEQQSSNLLQLTEDPTILYKSETQDFIEFNAQYVKQLKTHW